LKVNGELNKDLEAIPLEMVEQSVMTILKKKKKKESQ
jgi:hypothetical protein